MEKKQWRNTEMANQNYQRERSYSDDRGQGRNAGNDGSRRSDSDWGEDRSEGRRQGYHDRRERQQIGGQDLQNNRSGRGQNQQYQDNYMGDSYDSDHRGGMSRSADQYRQHGHFQSGYGQDAYGSGQDQNSYQRGGSQDSGYQSGGYQGGGNQQRGYQGSIDQGRSQYGSHWGDGGEYEGARVGSTEGRSAWLRGNSGTGEGRGDDRQQSGQSHAGRGPKNYQRSDERISEDVCDRMSDDHQLDASDIDVSVSGREVTLSGEVDSKQAKRRAEDCCDSVSGVEHVQNNLRVRKSGGENNSQEAAKSKNKS
tara:strand:+ start:10179 stop:11108 length:930 start_codon:yes stop_codon:yes gene_type:complete